MPRGPVAADRGAARVRLVAETHTCPVCKNPIIVRVGKIEKHAKNSRATFATERGRPRLVEWCEASDERWEEVRKRV
jgi:hypothetical protein